MSLDRSSAILCPAPLAARGFVLRPETPEDRPCLRRLFRIEREAMFALLPLPEDQKHRLLDNQFDCQLTHYRAAYPGFDILVLAHGAAPCGRLCLAGEADDIVLVDLLIDPAFRRQGIGGALIGAFRSTPPPWASASACMSTRPTRPRLSTGAWASPSWPTRRCPGR